MDVIQNKLREIKDYIGICLIPCNDFPGLHTLQELKYFNVCIENPVFYSQEYDKLLRMSGNNKIITKVEPNGHKRLAIYIK